LCFGFQNTTRERNRESKYQEYIVTKKFPHKSKSKYEHKTIRGHHRIKYNTSAYLHPTFPVAQPSTDDVDETGKIGTTKNVPYPDGSFDLAMKPRWY